MLCMFFKIMSNTEGKPGLVPRMKKLKKITHLHMSDLEELSENSWHSSLRLLLLRRCLCGQASKCSPSLR